MNTKTCTLEKHQYPILKGKLAAYNDDQKECEQLIKLGLKDFGFLIEYNTLFRLCYLGQKIKEYSNDKKAILIADLMIVNSYFYCPFLKKIDTIEQI